MPDPVDIDLDINGLGWPSDWSCAIITDSSGVQVKHCEGSFSIYFNNTTDLGTQDQLHINLLTADGGTLAVDMPLGE